MQYGYQGDLSLDWRSQNESDADKMAHMMATQVLVWETVVGERDANFNHVDPGSADAVKSVYRTSHPLYSRFSAYYDSIEASVQSNTVIPSFMSKTPNKAQTVELKWDGNQYTELAAHGHVHAGLLQNAYECLEVLRRGRPERTLLHMVERDEVHMRADTPRVLCQ